MSEITIKLPRLIFTDDSENFSSLATQFSIATGKDLSITELGFATNHGFVGALHEGVGTPENFQGLLDEIGIVLEE